MSRRRTLIASPLAWQDMAGPVDHPLQPVIADRGGTQLKAPKAMILVDTRERFPFSFSRFRGWFAGIEHCALALGDYSIKGLEHLCVVERKDLGDLVSSFSTGRREFVRRLRRMQQIPNRLLVITSPLSEVKSRYLWSCVNPNQVTQSLVATLAGLGVPFLCTETHELGAEIVASYLYQVHLYHWLECNGYGHYLADDDL
jgi:ERCC4-type nuclease